MSSTENPSSPKTPLVVPGASRPAPTAFKQQRLQAWQPVMSPPYVIGCLLLLTVICLPIGIAVLVASDAIYTVDLRYDNLPNAACPYPSFMNPPSFACAPLYVPFQVTKTLKAPVYLYYKLENFYQNFRRYAKSKSDVQLAGQSPSDNSDCNPFKNPGQFISLGGNETVTFTDGSAPQQLSSTTYYPCGLVAWSMFNDTLVLQRLDTTSNNNTPTLICDGGAFTVHGVPTVNQSCSKQGIAWPTDVSTKFVNLSLETIRSTAFLTAHGWSNVNVSTNNMFATHAAMGWYIGEEGHRIPNPADEDLMVWMRTASISTFRKLYRRIDVDLPPGSYQMKIFQRYDVSGFKGKKSFVLTTTSSWLGGPNPVLGGLYIAMGCMSLVLGIAFLAKFVLTPRHLAI